MDHKKFYNLKKLDEIARGDQGFVREMVVTFVENVTNDIDSIQSLKLVENWTVIGETAHKLASNFAYLGADSLQVLAASIEKMIINDKNLEGIADKTEKMCSEGTLLVNQLKKDFDITGII